MKKLIITNLVIAIITDILLLTLTLTSEGISSWGPGLGMMLSTAVLGIYLGYVLLTFFLKKYVPKPQNEKIRKILIIINFIVHIAMSCSTAFFLWFYFYALSF